MVDKTAQILDPERLEVLRKLEAKTGRNLLGQLFDLFREQTPLRLDKMRQALGEGDLKAAEGLAHSVKGSCLNLGVNALAQLCSDLEQLAKQGEAASCLAQMTLIDSEYEKVAVALEAARKSG